MSEARFSFFLKGYNKVFSIVTNIGEQLFMLESKYDHFREFQALTETGKVIWGQAAFCFP